MPDQPAEVEPTPAGGVSSWAIELLATIDAGGTADVPCGSCVSCCTSGQFVHIGPDETETLARIPADLLFPAPGLPRGHVLLGYDERGHCPMLVDGRCSIYEHRPRTCRIYDCRVFAATGVDPDQPAVAARVRRWRFEQTAENDAARHEALRAAARYLAEHAGDLPADAAPVNATQRAVLALRLHRLFLARDEATGRLTVVEPDPAAVAAEAARAAGRATGPAPRSSR